MNFKKVSLYLFCLTMAIVSCKKDDDDNITVEIRDRGEQQLADLDSINKYLDTHYYNSEELAGFGTDVSISDINITKLTENQSEVPVGHKLLRTAVGAPRIITYENQVYEYYVLNINQGGGDSPTFADDIRVNYEGTTLDNRVFDSTVNPTDFDLITDIAVEGWRRVLPEFNTAEGFQENGDGTVSYFNKGVGIMFLPSGLAYFSNATANFSSYSPLIFKFELLQMSENDHDGDGIPSYLEDLNGDGQFTVGINDPNDDDTDDDRNADFFDTDDDGDGILTKDEIVKTTITKPTLAELQNTPLLYNQVLLNKIKREQNGDYTGTIITFTDTDGVKPFDYLDKNY